MGLAGRSRVNFNRRRINVRKYLKAKNFLILSVVICIVALSVTSISGILLTRKIKNSTVVYSKDVDVIIDENSQVIEVMQDEVTPENIVTENEKENNEKDNNEQLKQEVTITNEELKSNIDLCILGEIMMGGQVGANLSNLYASAFKNVYSDIRSADFTYANFTTNITNLEEIENPKSKYIVTKDILSALNALGIDSVSIASDHIVDFPSDIIKNTINLLEEKNIFIAGRKDIPVYFEKGDKRVAIVSTNSVINGTSSIYEKAGISTYNKENLEKNIKEAKDSADIVIVDVHWGKEYEYVVTEKMKEIARTAIDCGADLIIGSHALGNYPISTYKGVPIIYSLGYFMGDSDLYLGKDSFIYNIEISKENKIEKITMKPIYINEKKEVLYYNKCNEEKSNEILNQYNTWNNENGLNSTITNSAITISF